MWPFIHTKWQIECTKLSTAVEMNHEGVGSAQWIRPRADVILFQISLSLYLYIYKEASRIVTEKHFVVYERRLNSISFCRVPLNIDLVACKKMDV